MAPKRQNSHRSSFLMAAFLGVLTLSGCATAGRAWKTLVGGDPKEATEQPVTPTRFSETDAVHSNSDRQYKRMNRQRMEDEAELGPNAGSLWVMEGQSGYLFAQNQMRMVGDLLNVKLEGAAKQQLQTKTKVIAKLLERLESPGLRGPASTAAPAGEQAAAGTPPAPAADAAGAVPPAPGSEAVASAKPEALTVQTVPTRIVETLKDGSYRVRGLQPFMIGKREYKVIVSGIVRPSDFDDGGIDSSKLLDSQFDIVSARKGAAL